ncbi:MAG: type II toxin-antitoxin system VapC family toxin [Streptosporangiaceae bacterium]
MIVIDASVLANVVGDDGSDGQRARQAFRDADDVAAPDLADVETVAVLRKRWIAGTVSDERFAAAVDDLRQLDIDRYPARGFIRCAYELRANVTVYDSVYVALAEALSCELLTADQRLANASGPRCAIRVLR